MLPSQVNVLESSSSSSQKPFVKPALTILFLTLQLVPQAASAQGQNPLTLSVGTHALTTPWYLSPVASAMNPAVFLGTDFSEDSRGRWRFFSGVNLGFFRHRWWMTSLSVEPELGVGWTFSGGFSADLRIGLGYMHYFWRRRTLELKEGRYANRRGWGKPSLILPLSATFGYRGGADDPLTVAPFLTARWGLQGLFLKEVPIMTHFFLLGGVRIQEEEGSSGGGE